MKRKWRMTLWKFRFALWQLGWRCTEWQSWWAEVRQPHSRACCYFTDHLNMTKGQPVLFLCIYHFFINFSIFIWSREWLSLSFIHTIEVDLQWYTVWSLWSRKLHLITTIVFNGEIGIIVEVFIVWQHAFQQICLNYKLCVSYQTGLCFGGLQLDWLKGK